MSLIRALRLAESTPFARVIRRGFEWDPRLTKKDGKPAITGSKHAYVASTIPVVLLRDVKGVGSKGSIVEVKRGFARNVLVPNGDAVYGTLWENVDSFADPAIIRSQHVEASTTQIHQLPPFNWLNDVEVSCLRDTSPTNPQKLSEPFTVREFMEIISLQEEFDFLPSQLDFPSEGITLIGRYTIPATLQLSVGTLSYSIKLSIQDKAEVAVAERREAELREAMKIKRPEFVLGSSRLARGSQSGINGDETSDMTDSDSE